MNLKNLERRIKFECSYMEELIVTCLTFAETRLLKLRKCISPQLINPLRIKNICNMSIFILKQYFIHGNVSVLVDL